MSKFNLPSLPYSYTSLEPIIDARTVEIHYDKHHRTYLNNLNATLEGHEELVSGKTVEQLLSDLNQIPTDIRQKVINFGGGYVNHNLYWFNLSPNGGGEPTGKLGKEIINTFGSFENFKNEFSTKAKALFGSGYTFLVVDNDSKKLEIMNTANQDTPYSVNKTPLFTIDVWEHAYYLNYQNRRPDYIESFWKIVNWDEINRRYVDALK